MIEELSNRAKDQTLGAVIEQIILPRLNQLCEALKCQDLSLERALELIEECRKRVLEEIVERGYGRGGVKGEKGFIAEFLEVYVGNARRAVIGMSENMRLDNDNGPIDYHIGNTAYQSKFVLKYLSTDALLEHAKQNPDFVRDGGHYSIASDLYEKVAQLAQVPESDLGTLKPTEQTLWRKVQNLKDIGIEPGKNLGPSAFKYADVKRENYEKTLAREEVDIRATHKNKREAIKNSYKPTLDEAAKATATGAALEAATSFGLGAYKKIKSGKRLVDFTAEDWKELGIDTTKGGVRGAFRGSAVYLLTAYAELPGSIASASVTASLGIAGQAAKLRAGTISPQEFAENSEILCLDSALSALFALMGQTFIPVPVLGALIGTIACNFAYEIAKVNLSAYEQGLIADALIRIEQYGRELDQSYELLVEEYRQRSDAFKESLARTMQADATLALEASAEHARMLGVSRQALPATEQEVSAFFES